MRITEKMIIMAAREMMASIGMFELAKKSMRKIKGTLNILAAIIPAIVAPTPMRKRIMANSIEFTQY